ncbi:MAG: zinc ribbon domain-containing protein [Novosphingobium sp.]|nr:zinc ribbon domain-containing protein [Novosphingobium sp.]
MPLFDFHCPHCDQTVELLLRAADPAACPKCGGTDLKRLVSRVSPPGKSKAMASAARAQAGREGHLSNFG